MTTNLPAALSTLDQQIGALAEQLRPVNDAHVARAVNSLLNAGLMLPSGIKMDKAPEVYAFALSGVPASGVQKATQGIIRGEYPIKHGFIPTPPEFAAIARLETKTLRDDLMRLREHRAALDDYRPRPKTSDEEKARIRALHEQFKAAHAASKLKAPAEDEMTPEQKAYWARIAALRSADASKRSQES